MAVLAVAGSSLFFARAVTESAGQLRATLRGLAARPASVLDHEPATPANSEVTASASTSAGAATPPPPEREPAPRQDVAGERDPPRSGPPSAAEVAQLIDGGFVPEAQAEDTAALRAALEAAAP